MGATWRSCVVALGSLAGWLALGPSHPFALAEGITMPAPPAFPGAAPNYVEIDRWIRKNGLPHNSVTAILQARDGYLWVGTLAGVARFDGVRFLTFDERGGQLPENEVRGLAEGPDGSLWIGTHGGGLSRLRQGRFERYSKRDGLVDDFVNDLSIDPRGRVWIATDRGVSAFDGTRFRTFDVAAGLPEASTRTLHADPSGTVWVASWTGGLSRIDEDRVSVVMAPGKTPWSSLRAIRGDGAGALYLATFDGLFRLQAGAWTRFTTADGLSADRLPSLHQDRQGTLWIGAVNGLHLLRDGKIVRLPGVADAGAATISSDHEGGIWIAGSSALVLVREGQFVSYSTRNGLSYGFVTTVVEDRAGSIWIATGKGLNRLDEGALAVFGAEQGLPEAVIGALAEDGAGHLWVGTDKGIYRSREPARAGQPPAPPRFERVPNQPTPPLVSRLMHVASDGAIWVGTAQQGLARFHEGSVSTWTTREGLLHDAVRGIEDDGAGGLWIASHGGLQHLTGAAFTSYTERDGLPGTMLEGLGRDRTGALWIGSKRGVARLANGRFTVYRERDGLFSGFVNAFIDDGRGNLWMGSSQGVFRVALAELERFAAGRAPAVSSVVYGLENGMITEVVTGGAEFCRPMYQSRDGRIWVALTRGVSVVDPAHLQARRPSPPVTIEAVSANEQALELAPHLRVPPGRGDLAVRYAALGFVGAHKTRFKYRLDGYDRDWQDGEDRRIAQYSNLRPGRYTFRVIAANSDGVWNQKGAAVELTLVPAWYQSLFFRGLTAAALVLAAAALHRWRLRRLQGRERELERKVVERTAALEAIVKELESFSYSASHDLRAPLRSIEGFSKVLGQHLGEGVDPAARELLARMQKDSARMRALVEDLLSLARVGKSELRHGPVDLGSVVREIAVELRERERAREVELVVADDLVVEGDAGLLRIALANLLGNAWKFTGRQPAARIEVGTVGRDGSGVRVFFVRDNGAGFDGKHAGKLFQPFQRLHGVDDFEGTGVGLATVQRIVHRHGGRVWAEGAVGQGASFFFTLPG